MLPEQPRMATTKSKVHRLHPSGPGLPPVLELLKNGVFNLGGSVISMKGKSLLRKCLTAEVEKYQINMSTFTTAQFSDISGILQEFRRGKSINDVRY